MKVPLSVALKLVSIALPLSMTLCLIISSIKPWLLVAWESQAMMIQGQVQGQGKNPLFEQAPRLHAAEILSVQLGYCYVFPFDLNILWEIEPTPKILRMLKP